MDSVDPSCFRQSGSPVNVRDSATGKHPSQEIHRCDSHANAEENAGQHALRAAFTKRESEPGDDDGNEREAASDGAGECLLQHADGVFPGRASLSERRRGEKQQHKTGEYRASRAKPASKVLPTSVHGHTSTKVLHRKLRCEESPRLRYAPRVAAGTHWSEDTLGLPRMNLARCVLTPRSSKGVCCVNSPLSTYSVLGKKNVSQKKENTFEGLKGL